MTMDTFAMWYFIAGILTCFLNGAIRKIEADALLGLTWFLFWPMTPIAGVSRFVEWSFNGLKHYQPLRRTRIFFLRKF